MSAEASISRSSESTFLFADLSGFTALTEVHGDEQAADLAGDFAAAVRELLPEHGAEHIKSIGDAFLHVLAAMMHGRIAYPALAPKNATGKPMEVRRPDLTPEAPLLTLPYRPVAIQPAPSLAVSPRAFGPDAAT